MNEKPMPLLRSPFPEDQSARELLAQVKAPAPWPDANQDRLWTSLQDRIGAGGRSHRPLVWTLGVAVAFASVLLLFFSRPETGSERPTASAPWTALRLPTQDLLELSPDALFRHVEMSHGATRVYLDAGSIRAEVAARGGGRSFEVLTPHLTVTVVGTRFTVQVSPQGTTVKVQEGRVRVSDTKGQTRLLDPGEEMEARVEAPRPAPSASPLTQELGAEGDCAELPDAGERRKACYEQRAKGGGLAAENALFVLGELARKAGHSTEALRHWRAYQQRFPSGALEPEVSVAILGELLSERRFAEALAEAEHLDARYGAQARALARSTLEGRFQAIDETSSLTGWVHRLASGAEGGPLP